MNRLVDIRKRNLVFIHFYWSSLLAHALLGIALSIPYTYELSAAGLITVVMLFVLNRSASFQFIVPYLLLLSMNGYVFGNVLRTGEMDGLYFFIAPILLASLYFNVKQTILISAMTFAELVYFFVSASNSQLAMMISAAELLAITTVMTIYHSSSSRNVISAIEKKSDSMELALLSKEGYLQLFFENAKDSIAVFDLNDVVIDVNPAFEELYGWSRQEIIGKVVPLVPKEKLIEANQRRQEVLNGKSFSLLETQDIRKDGTYFDAMLTLSPIFDHNGKVIATSVISRDISYQKETERMIVQSEKLKLAGEMAAGVAHEIRNPMTVVSGFVQMMHHDPKHPYQAYTKLILSELERINLIIGEFLVLSKPQAVRFQTLSLKDTLKDVLILYGPEFTMHDIILNETWQQEDFHITGEENQLKQVFINLLKNAIEATGTNGKLSLRVEAAVSGTVAIRLRDNGCGVSEETLAKIFEPFFTTKATGTGLGLVISQKIIQEHGGTLTITSELNKGTEVSVLLPVVEKPAPGQQPADNLH